MITTPDSLLYYPPLNGADDVTRFDVEIETDSWALYGQATYALTDNLNLNSLVVLSSSKAEPSLANAPPGNRYQFERKGYFCVDSKDSRADRLVFNRTVTLRDTWAKIQKAQQTPG